MPNSINSSNLIDLGIEEELVMQKILVPPLPINGKKKYLITGGMGLQHPKAVLLMGLWYLFSAFNLFANKYIITFLDGDPALLGIIPAPFIPCKNDY